jgi:general secretion pathway protein I
MRDERGFTLLEVLVAFVIAALALGLLYEGALGGLVATRVAGQVEEATSRARSHLAVVGHGTAISPGDTQGDDGGGYRWRLSIRRTATAPAARGDAVTVARGPHAALYAVTVRISWEGDGGVREVRLDSERVGLAPPAPP